MESKLIRPLFGLAAAFVLAGCQAATETSEETQVQDEPQLQDQPPTQLTDSRKNGRPMPLFKSAVGSNYYKLSKIYRYLQYTDHLAWPYPTASNYTREGLAWYILDGTEQDLAGSPAWEVYRSWDGVGDWMTSKSTNEGGYGSATALGKLFPSANLTINNVAIVPAPLQPINRYVKNWTSGTWPYQKSHMDHLTPFPGENPSGYSNEGTLGYGFPRYIWDREFGAGAPPIDKSITGNGVTVGFVKSWGGAISGISWNSVNYINRKETGRLMALAVNHARYSEQYNPTEGGDVNINGSPVIYYNTIPENTPTSKKFSTRTIPLMYKNPDGTEAAKFIDGLSPNNALLYGGTMAKEVEIMNDIAVTGGQVKVVRVDYAFTPNETRTWGMIHVCVSMAYQGFMADLGPTLGYHHLYASASPGAPYTLVQTKSGLNQVTLNRPQDPVAGWGQPWPVQNAGVRTLGIAEGNGTGKALGILIKDGQSPATYKVEYTSQQGYTEGWGTDQYSENSHSLMPQFWDVSLTSGQMFWCRVYILLGTKSQILAAANSFPY